MCGPLNTTAVNGIVVSEMFLSNCWRTTDKDRSVNN